MKYTLYLLRFGQRKYWSTNIIEMTAFCKSMGMLGYAEIHKQVYFEINNVIETP